MKEHMSPSQLKDFMGCEAYALAKVKGELEPEPEGKELITGKLIEAILEGHGDEFIAEYHDTLIAKTGKTKGEIKADYKHAIDVVVPRVQQDKMFMEYLEGEKQFNLEFDWLGVHWKMRPDIVNWEKKRIVDLKSTKDMKRVWNNGQYVSFGEAWMYDFQLALYQKGIEIITGGEIFDCYIAAVSKEKVPDFDVFEVEQMDIDECQEQVEKYLPRILALKSSTVKPNRCGVCNYCKATKVLTKPINYKLAGMDPAYLD